MKQQIYLNGAMQRGDGSPSTSQHEQGEGRATTFDDAPWCSLPPVHQLSGNVVAQLNLLSQSLSLLHVVQQIIRQLALIELQAILPIGPAMLFCLCPSGSHVEATVDQCFVSVTCREIVETRIAGHLGDMPKGLH